MKRQRAAHRVQLPAACCPIGPTRRVCPTFWQVSARCSSLHGRGVQRDDRWPKFCCTARNPRAQLEDGNSCWSHIFLTLPNILFL